MKNEYGGRIITCFDYLKFFDQISLVIGTQINFRSNAHNFFTELVAKVLLTNGKSRWTMCRLCLGGKLESQIKICPTCQPYQLPICHRHLPNICRNNICVLHRLWPHCEATSLTTCHPSARAVRLVLRIKTQCAVQLHEQFTTSNCYLINNIHQRRAIFITQFAVADLPWCSRLVRHRSGVREALGSIPVSTSNQGKCVEDELNKRGKEGGLEEEGIHEGENLTEDKQTSCGRSVKFPSRLQDYELYTSHAFSAEEMPQTYEESMQDEGRKLAINNELNAHRKNGNLAQDDLGQLRFVLNNTSRGIKYEVRQVVYKLRALDAILPADDRGSTRRRPDERTTARGPPSMPDESPPQRAVRMRRL
ncbi:hypothetical protein PR048_002030 [Dryococelus australis]|uniref:Uncharacterized protein n=1 Tax=Dryococelus australis TaxID=614101 RepID=A0ABQ9IJ02_9NEOP|nr:hypothetical protein PR048_002030 [Dryococelus australis]